MPARRGAQADTKLARWRMRRGLSQAELARAVGLTRTTYWRLESGQVRDPRLRMLVNLSIALGCELDDLLEDEWRSWHAFDRTHASEPPTTAELWRER